MQFQALRVYCSVIRELQKKKRNSDGETSDVLTVVEWSWSPELCEDNWYLIYRSLRFSSFGERFPLPSTSACRYLSLVSADFSQDWFKMNGDRQMEVHYINTGFPYTITESFMDFFEGLTYAQPDFAFTGAMYDQESAYWSMHANSYKFGLSGPGSTSYYAYEVNDHVPRIDGSRRAWENPFTMNSEDTAPVVVQGGENASVNSDTGPEECIRGNHNARSSQVFWQDNVDPDNMTYEELLDLGEAVGTQSRGLSQELLSTLPISKYKRGFFRKRRGSERCVICQMEYKRGDRRITLPCKHIYHAGCGARWLSINKACPVCYTEVFGEESRH